MNEAKALQVWIGRSTLEVPFFACIDLLAWLIAYLKAMRRQPQEALLRACSQLGERRIFWQK